MEKLYREYGGPFTLVLVLGLAISVFARLVYGVDLTFESANYLSEREAWLPLAQSGSTVDLTFLDLRHIAFFLQFSVALLLGLSLRKDLPRPALCLSFVLLFCYVPRFVYGFTSIHLLIPSLCGFQCAAWAWWQNPRRSMSLLLPFLALALVFCHPWLAFYAVPVLLILFFRTIPGGKGLAIKLSLLAAINLSLLLLFAVMRKLGWEMSLDLLFGEKPWLFMGADAGTGRLAVESLLTRIFPTSLQVFIFMMAGIFSLLMPAKYFHYFFAGLAILYVLSLRTLGVTFSAVESFLVFAMPLLAGHFWKIRKALLPEERIRFAMMLLISALPLLYYLFDFSGLAVGSLFLFSLTFVIGHLRGVQIGASVSALTLAVLFVSAQYQHAPPHQAVKDSIEVLDQGVFKGLTVTRALKNEFVQMGEALKPLAGGPASLYMDRYRPEYYLLTGLDPVPGLPLDPESRPALQLEKMLTESDNLPDMMLLFLTDEAGQFNDTPLASFFLRHPAYRSYRETERYRIFVKSEFLDKLSK